MFWNIVLTVETIYYSNWFISQFLECMNNGWNHEGKAVVGMFVELSVVEMNN